MTVGKLVMRGVAAWGEKKVNKTAVKKGKK